MPTVREIVDSDYLYLGLASALAATPYDFMVQLDDVGLDWNEVSQYELFLMVLSGMITDDTVETSMLFGSLDIHGFRQAKNPSGEIVFYHKDLDIEINEAVSAKIIYTLRKINNIASKNKLAGNDEARQYLLKRARKKQAREMRRRKDGDINQLESLIVAFVNTHQSSYTFETVLDMSIYQFHLSIMQVVKKTNYDNIMIGHYTGNLNANELSQSLTDWLLITQN